MIYIILYCSAAITSALPSSVPTKFDASWELEESLTHLLFRNKKTKDSYFFPKAQCVVHIDRE